MNGDAFLIGMAVFSILALLVGCVNIAHFWLTVGKVDKQAPVCYKVGEVYPPRKK